MIKVLFECPINQDDGWGNAARHYAKPLISLHNKGKIELKIRPTVMSNSICRNAHHSSFYENDPFGFDVIIQNVLPHMFYKYECKKNIGLFYTETRKINPLWIKKISETVDSIIVPTKQEQENLSRDVKCKIHQINMPVYDETINYSHKKEDTGVVKFYTICNYCTRKNLTDMILGFYRAFVTKDNVELIIKTNTDIDNILVYCKGLFFQRRLPKIVVINKKLTEEEMQNLHKSCHCYVSTSFGESTCIPLIDALLYNNRAMVTRGTGMMNTNSPILYGILSNEVFCESFNSPINFLYKYPETWMKVDESNLINTYRILHSVSLNCNQNNNFYSIKEQYSTNKIEEKIYEAITT